MNRNVFNNIPWFVDIFCEYRDELYVWLLEHDIQTRKIYPPLNEQKVNFGWHNNSFNFRWMRD
jgi:hypothetical protein